MKQQVDTVGFDPYIIYLTMLSVIVAVFATEFTENCKSVLLKSKLFCKPFQVRGVGLAGYYRLPVDEEPDETEEKQSEKEGEEAEVFTLNMPWF